MNGETRSPKVKIILGGEELPGVLMVDIDSNNHFAADRFRVRFASSLVPESQLHVPGVEIEIQLSQGDLWVTCLVGLIDTVSSDICQKTIEIEGRDLSSQMIEAQTDETFANRTSSEIAEMFGARHGITTIADQTLTPIGRFYQSEHDRTSIGQFSKTTTEWDLLAYLAVREGFDLYMMGRVLRFGLPMLSGATRISDRDCISLQVSHCVNLARPIDVLVKSWNSKTSVTIQGHAISSGLGPVWQRSITRPNLSGTDAQTQAQRVIDDLKRHEWTASLTMPGELNMTARSIIAFDDVSEVVTRLFSVSQLSRRLDVKHGFTQSLTLQGQA